MVIILYLWYIQNGAPKLLLMAQPLKHPQSESATADLWHSTDLPSLSYELFQISYGKLFTIFSSQSFIEIGSHAVEFWTDAAAKLNAFWPRVCLSVTWVRQRGKNGLRFVGSIQVRKPKSKVKLSRRNINDWRDCEFYNKDSLFAFRSLIWLWLSSHLNVRASLLWPSFRLMIMSVMSPCLGSLLEKQLGMNCKLPTI